MKLVTRFLCSLLLASPAAMKSEPTVANLSPAHVASRALVIDPQYNALSVMPAADVKPEAAPWLYGDGQLEAWKINQLVTEGFKAGKHVDYEKNYGRVAPKCLFRRQLAGRTSGSVQIRAHGSLVARIGQRIVLEAAASSKAHVLTIPADVPEGAVLEIAVMAGAEEPGALLITDSLFLASQGWEWSGDGKMWSPAVAHFQTQSGGLPHLAPEPLVRLQPVKLENGIYDFGVPVLGRPTFTFQGEPQIFAGESVAEVDATEAQCEFNRQAQSLGGGRWTSLYPIGFRYLRITGGTPSDVAVEAAFHPVRYRGAFASSDEKLGRIWMQAAFTLRSCMHGLMLDGIKRDRMPWIGDQSVGLVFNAYTFAEPEIIRQSFVALGRPQRGFINGIVDYSLWWVINHDWYQRYFDDAAYLQREWPQVDAYLRSQISLTDKDGLLRPPASAWVFIDWGVTTDKKNTSTSLQIMWWWAQHSAARLARKNGDEASARFWSTRTEALGRLLTEKAWDTGASAWKEYLETPATTSPYPNLLAVLSGLAPASQHAGIRRNLLEHPGQGTPFMKALELMALSQVGGTDVAMQRIRAYWGEMFDAGALTFWEDFKQGEKSHHDMYNRPFGRSLCHAWSSGPAALLPIVVLGVQPLADGWKEFSVAPHLGDLDHAMSTVPTPHGDIEVSADRGGATVVVPAGTTLVVGEKRHPGPCRVSLPAK
jgi:alpha-L-rhamnosidase